MVSLQAKVQSSNCSFLGSCGRVAFAPVAIVCPPVVIRENDVKLHHATSEQDRLQIALAQ